MSEAEKESLKEKISEVLNCTGAYTQIQDLLKKVGSEVDNDSDIWNEVEESIVEILTTNE